MGELNLRSIPSGITPGQYYSALTPEANATHVINLGELLEAELINTGSTIANAVFVALPEECLRDMKPGDALHDLYFAGMTFGGPLFALDNPELSDAPPASASPQPSVEPSLTSS